MKKTLLILVALLATNMMFAIKVYINAGHGSWGSEDRNMATITHALGDTTGFYESNTNLWKALQMEAKLKQAGFTVMMSRRTNGESRALSSIKSEANNSGSDYFISIHSNAGPEGEIGGSSGKFANYPVMLFRGTNGNPYVSNSDKMAKASVLRLYEIFWTTPANKNGTGADGGPEFTSYYSPSNPDILGDYSFYGYHLGVLPTGVPGFLAEGYFHTYSPARHRALNPDWCRQEGIRYARGVKDYFGKSGESVGYIMGYVRSQTEQYTHTYYIPYKNSNDIYKPINGAKIYLYNANGDIVKTNCYKYVKRELKNQDYYTTDNNYNGVFVYDDLTPGTYTMVVKASGYKTHTQTVVVTADKTIYPEIFLTPGKDPEPVKESRLNPYAYKLSSELAADSSTIKVHFYLNGLASTVKVIFNDGEKDYVARSYTNVKAGGYSSVIAIDTMPKGKPLSWRVDITGPGLVAPLKSGKEYYFLHPTSVDVDDNPQSPNFGRLLCNEGYHSIKSKAAASLGASGATFDTYKSYTLGAGLYEFNAEFDYVTGYNGGHSFTANRLDVTSQAAVAPHRIRIADDGRIFVTSFNGGSTWSGKIMWTIKPESMNTWVPAFWYNQVASNSELQTTSGEYIAAPNVGLDVQGSGENLKVVMLSATNECYDNKDVAYSCYEYNWGTIPAWNVAAPKKWFDGNSEHKVINHLGAQVQYDNQGGLWVCQHRASATNDYPSLVYYDKDGVCRYHEAMNNRGGGGFRFNKDFTRVIISGGNAIVGEATVYTVNKDANGYPTQLTKEFTIPMDLGTGICDFAWDYADNVYAVSYTKEKLVAYATPHDADKVVSTPAMSKYGFTLTEKYTVTASANDATMGTVSGAGVYVKGAKATLTATANEGYEFVNWTINGETITTNPTTITVNSDVNAVANFALIQHTVTATVNDPAMGSVEGAGVYTYGASATLTAIANEGYEFVGWTVGENTLTDNPLTLTVTSDVAVVATFKAIEHTVTATVNDPAMGSVEGAGVYTYGASATLTAIANEGYEFVGWTVGENTVTDNPLTLTVTSDVTVVATFKAIEHTVTATVNDPAMGSVEGAGVYTYGASATLTAIANEGYEFVGWMVNGEALTDNPLLLTVTSDVTVVATFKAIEHTITATVNDPTMGTVEGAGVYTYGASATLTATASEGYEFVGWMVNGEALTDNPLTLTVTGDVTVVATFKAIEHTVTATVNDPAMGSVEGAGVYNYGASATLTATANEGYEFVGWTIGENTVIDNPLTLTVTSDVTVEATFKAIEHTITATVNDPAMGTVEGAGVYTYGATATLTATANEGYEFVGWTVGENTVTDNPLTLTVTSDVTVVATFKAIEHTVTATVNDPAMGTVEGAGVYTYGASATLTATANEGYEFVGWMVNGEALTDNPLTLTVTSDVTVEATFAAVKYNVIVLINDSTMGTVEGAGVYEYGTTAILTATPYAGYEFVNWEVGGETYETNPLDLLVNADMTVVLTFKSTVVTGVDNMENEGVKVEKLFRDGQLYIIRGDKVYTITGNRVE